MGSVEVVYASKRSDSGVVVCSVVKYKVTKPVASDAVHLKRLGYRTCNSFACIRAYKL